MQIKCLQLFFSLTILIFLTNCRKLVEPDFKVEQKNVVEQFFKITTTIDPTVEKVLNKIKIQNDRNHFVEQFVTKNGFPNWEKSLVAFPNNGSSNARTNNENGNIVFIPFNLANQTTAYLSCTIVNDSVEDLRLYTKSLLKNALIQYKNDSANKRKTLARISLLAHFEKQQFQKDSLTLVGTGFKSIKTNSISFSNTNTNTNTNASGRSTTSEVFYVTSCYTTNTAPVGAYQLVGLSPGASTIIANEPVTVCNTYPIVVFSQPATTQSTLTTDGDCWYCPSDGNNNNTGGGADFVYVQNYLDTALQLNSVHLFQLQQPENTVTLMQLYNLIASEPDNAENKQLANLHLEQLLTDTSYRNFVNTHYNTTNMPLSIWWKDYTWLNNTNNFNLAAGNYLTKGMNNIFNSMEFEDNYTTNDYDTTRYLPYDSLPASFPNTVSVISISNFIGWEYPGVRKNCFDYAKKQIAVAGYKLSNYFVPGQTIQAYKHPNGADSNKCKKAIAYLYSAVQRGIPVVIGVDEGPGSPNKKTDKTTDHFVVIVGMGKDSFGNYFTFYDNATSNVVNGTSTNNKLYINTTTWIISGVSDVYGPSLPYILTMVRKSKL